MTVLNIGDVVWAVLAVAISGTILVVAVWTVIDVVRRPDVSGATTVMWVVLVVVFPLVGVVIYAAVDAFRRTDLPGGQKAVWIAVLVLFPAIAVAIYVITTRETRAARTSRPVQPADPHAA